MLQNIVFGAVLTLLSSGQVLAQDWKVPLGNSHFYLDTRTVGGTDKLRRAWVRAHEMSPDGLINVEFDMHAMCDVEVVARWRIVVWSHHSDHVVDERIPQADIFQSAPFSSDVDRDFFEFLCK
jgi:hypothetical protein